MKTPTRFTNIPKFIDENSPKADFNENTLHYLMTSYNRVSEWYESIINDMKDSPEDLCAYSNQFRLDKENLCVIIDRIGCEGLAHEAILSERDELLKQQDKLAEKIAKITRRLVELED